MKTGKGGATYIEYPDYIEALAKLAQVYVVFLPQIGISSLVLAQMYVFSCLGGVG